MLRDKDQFINAAKHLKARREAMGFSVIDLANKLGVSPSRYRTWEKIFGPLPQRQYGDAINRILEGNVQPDDSLESDGFVADLDYRELGRRAAERRESLGYPRKPFSDMLKVSFQTLKSWETSLPQAHREAIEDAWEDLLQVPRGWLRQPGLEPPELLGAGIDLAPSNALSVADEIRSIAAWLARNRVGTRTLDFRALSEQEQRRANIFAERYGVAGEDKTVLQIIADQFGLTRERVRQITEKMAERARGVQFKVQRFDQLRTAANQHQFWTVRDFEVAHAELLGGVALNDADRFGREILGQAVASLTDHVFPQGSHSVQPVLSDPATQDVMVAIRAASLKMIRSCGAAHLAYVAGLVVEATGQAVPFPVLRKSVGAIDGMEWLTQDKDWYWFGAATPNNRALEAVRKVVSVAGRKVDVEDLHHAVCRSRRAYYRSEARTQPPELEVPQEILREMLLRTPWLSVVQMNDFLLTGSTSVEDVLNASERAVVQLIEEHGGAAVRQIFNQRLVISGVFTIPNLQFVLTASPVIKQLAFGIYGIRGRDFPLEAFSRARESLAKFRVPAEMDDEGWCEFSLAISDAGFRNHTVDFPVAVSKAIVPGVYTMEGLARGTFSFGTVPSAPSRTSGLVGLLRNADIQPKELLRFRIHSESRRALLSRAIQVSDHIEEQGE